MSIKNISRFYQEKIKKIPRLEVIQKRGEKKKLKKIQRLRDE
jgi:hypothetical protein